MNFILELTIGAVLSTIAEEGALLAVDDMMTFVADAHAHCTDASVACEAARVAVIPVLVFELLACAYESALFLRSAHVLEVFAAIVVLFLTESTEQCLLLIFVRL